MRFAITQRYDASPEEVDHAYADPDLYPTLVGLPKLGDIRVLAHDAVPARRLRVQFHFTGHLPSAVTAVVHPEKLSWIQESEHDHEALSARFRLLPDHYPDRLRCAGRFTIAAAPNGAIREVRGDLKVNAPLLAGRVEKAIISGLEEYLGAESTAVDRWILDQG